jgi:hypothetical protein
MSPDFLQISISDRSIRFAPLSYDLVRSHEHSLRNRQSDLLGGFQIDHQLELRRLLDREIGGFGSL